MESLVQSFSKNEGKKEEKVKEMDGGKCSKAVKEKFLGSNISKDIPVIFNDYKSQIHEM